MRKQWVTGLALVTVVGCAVSTVGTDEPGQPPSATPGSASVPPGSALVPHAGTVAEINAALDKGHTVDWTTFSVIGDPSIADFRVQTRLRLAQEANAPKVEAATSPTFWQVRGNAPVRTTPAAYGATFNVQTSTDLVAFATDTGVGGTGGLNTADVSNGCSGAGGNCAAATQFFLSDLYSSAHPHVAGWAASASNKFEIGAQMFSFNPARIQIFSLAYGIGNVFCFQMPAAGSGYTNTTNNLATKCTGWTGTGVDPLSVGNNKITWSAPFPSYDGSGNITSFYYGDDAGKLQCVNTCTNGTCTSAPQSCGPGTGGGGGSYGTAGCSGTCGFAIPGVSGALGPPVVERVSYTSQTVYENLIFVGDTGGQLWQLDDVNGTVTAKHTAALGSAMHGAPAIDYSGQRVYAVSGGKMWQFPLAVWASSPQAALSSVSLPGLAAGTAIVSSITLDTTAAPYNGGNYAYITANNTLFKVAYDPAGGALGSAFSRVLAQSVTANTTVDSNTIGPSSMPMGYALPWAGETYVGTGTGGTSTTGAVEAYGCASSAANPFLVGMSNAPAGPFYGAAVETGLIIDNAIKNLYFGYDNGNNTGGLLAYPLPNNPSASYGCPTGTTSTAGAACGSAGCTPNAGVCFSDADCAGTPTTPACNPATHACVQCSLTNSSLCVAPTPACDATVGSCVECTADSNCSANATKKHCQNVNATLGTGADPSYEKCVECVAARTNAGQATADAMCAPQANAASGRCELARGTGALLTAETAHIYKCVACSTGGTSGAAGNNASANLSRGTCNKTGTARALCNLDTGNGAPFFDECIPTTQNASVVCSEANCTGGSICNGSNCTSAAPSFTPLPHCDLVTTSPMYQFCVECSSNSPAQCTAPASCDLTLTDTTVDQCTSCTPVNSNDNTTPNGCTAANGDAQKPVCSSTAGCQQCAQGSDCPLNFCDTTGSVTSGYSCVCSTAADCPANAQGSPYACIASRCQ